MADFSSDQDQVEQLKKWWHSYGKVLITAIVIGLAAGYGWKYWQAQKLVNAESASMMYQEVLMAEMSVTENKTAPLIKALKTEYPSTPYAALASLMAAKNAVAEKKLPEALAALDWVITKSSVKEFKQIAYLRKARVLSAQKKYDQALAILKLVNDDVFSPAADVIRGDVYVAKGDMQLASQAYLAAKDSFNAQDMTDQITQLKLARYGTAAQNGEKKHAK